MPVRPGSRSATSSGGPAPSTWYSSEVGSVRAGGSAGTSFCLVTPNWFVRLPGHPYDGGDPDGFMLRDEVVAHLERYAVKASVREGVEVTELGPGPNGGLLERLGEIVARAVVAAPGPSSVPPPGRSGHAAFRPASIDVEDHRNPATPAGPALVVGGGQSGGQIAEESTRRAGEAFKSAGGLRGCPRLGEPRPALVGERHRLPRRQHAASWPPGRPPM